ncbi:succinate dehydrogenase assembly factor 2 [Apophysomyces sp. BC1034]|nr:succinate dehydrogenase assembly factor 2 [Apophysomyces sp. BC1015]KAG0168674.1 succinate dehydrogenase assembly factor 2 [Apophysomyces sp. BC1021]KAG0187638.1 succinate dehydrogenase assembly factor 2 [Apophysomyces sp. BC1034]
MSLARMLARPLRLAGHVRSVSTTAMRMKKQSEDPYPDLRIRHAPQMDIDSPYPNLPPIPRPEESLENKRARLTYQSRKRGILETDLLLSTFAKEHLANFGMDDLMEYDRLLDEPDWDIFYWATNKKTLPERWQKSKVLDMIREHSKNEKKVVLRMPDLEQHK